MPPSPSARHRTRRSWTRQARWAVPLTAALAATGFYISRGATTQVQTADPVAAAAACAPRAAGTGTPLRKSGRAFGPGSGSWRNIETPLMEGRIRVRQSTR